MKQDFKITIQKYGFLENGTNYVNHNDGLLIMRHEFSFEGNIMLFFKFYNCEITFYEGPIFEEKFLKYIVNKWHINKSILIDKWSNKHEDNKKYMLRNPECYIVEKDHFGIRNNEKEIFSPIIFPIISVDNKNVKWKLTHQDFNKMQFEYFDKEDKAIFFKHMDKNLLLGLTAGNTFIYDYNNNRHIDIEYRVYYDCKTLTVFKMLNLLNH
jgi:hypothetical protein